MAALRARGGWADVVIVIDALRFTSLVSLAVNRGPEVVPWPEPVWPSEAEVAAWPAATDAAGRTAVLLRRDGVSALQMVRTIQPRVRFVQASDNGAPLATQTGSTPTLAGAFRDAAATAAAAMHGGKRILVVPVGERWPDGTLRPALEDWLAAGAIISRLDGDRSAEAQAAAEAFAAARGDLHERLLRTASGQELVDRGDGDDVALAAEIDRDGQAARLNGGAFQAAAS